MWHVIRVIKFEGFWKPHTCWGHFFYLRVRRNVPWDAISCGVTVYPVSAMRDLSLEKGNLWILVSLLLTLEVKLCAHWPKVASWCQKVLYIIFFHCDLWEVFGFGL